MTAELIVPRRLSTKLLYGPDDLFEDFTQPQEVFEPRGLLDVPTCAEACGVSLVHLRVRRTENHYGNVAASFTSTHCLQYLAARFPGQIKVDDNEIRTIDKRLSIQRPDVIDGFLPNRLSVFNTVTGSPDATWLRHGGHCSFRKRPCFRAFDWIRGLPEDGSAPATRH